MNTNKINTLNTNETELSATELEEVNGGLLCELAVAGAVVAGAAIGTAAVVGTAAAIGTAAALAECSRPRPRRCNYEYTYCRETVYRW
ncbi:MAG: hypothetical protein IKD72_03965 [Clostridia bacterium]|nr:hypothetical protein [Clostridia bacterium]